VHPQLPHRCMGWTLMLSPEDDAYLTIVPASSGMLASVSSNTHERRGQIFPTTKSFRSGSHFVWAWRAGWLCGGTFQVRLQSYFLAFIYASRFSSELCNCILLTVPLVWPSLYLYSTIVSIFCTCISRPVPLVRHSMSTYAYLGSVDSVLHSSLEGNCKNTQARRTMSSTE
jgi:hypothetical protein